MQISFQPEFQIRSEGRPSIGIIALQSDETLECELRHYFPGSTVNLYITRVPSASEVTQETLAQMAGKIEAAAALLPPSISFDVVGYCCTSGTAVIGADKVATRVHAGCQTQYVSEPVTAVVNMCRQHNIRRLACLSPYIEGVSDVLRATLAESGIETPVFGSFNVSQEEKVARIDPTCTKKAAVKLLQSVEAQAGYIDGLFLSCTNLKTQGILDEISVISGLPVFSSNSALAMHIKDLASVKLTKINVQDTNPKD